MVMTSLHRNQNCKFNTLEEYSRIEINDIAQSKEKSMEFIDLLSNGTIVVIRNILNIDQTKNIIDYFQSSKAKKDFKFNHSPKVLEDTKNFSYTSNFINSSNDKYTTVDNSFYIFPWNKDQSPITNLVGDFYDDIISIQGYDPKKIYSNTPKDYVIQRVHLIHYPINTGHISTHTDPDDVCKLVCGIYLTEFNLDYTSGGFYVVNNSGEPFHVDPLIKAGDAVLFYPTMPHGVWKIENNKLNESQGRFFIDMKIVNSHEKKSREFTKSFNN